MGAKASRQRRLQSPGDSMKRETRDLLRGPIVRFCAPNAGGSDPTLLHSMAKKLKIKQRTNTEKRN